MQDILEITLLVTGVFERLGVAYLVGGSLASSLHGIPRATQDVDLVADLRPEHVSPFVHALQDAFYVDDAMIRDAVRRRASFNVIHLATMFKIDVFLPQHDAVLRQEMQRRQAYSLADDQHLVVASPEDIILQKLHWYRLGGEVSDRQWNDVLGVMKVQGGALDQAYLTQTAVLLDVVDLLQRALREAGQTKETSFRDKSIWTRLSGFLCDWIPSPCLRRGRLGRDDLKKASAPSPHRNARSQSAHSQTNP